MMRTATRPATAAPAPKIEPEKVVAAVCTAQAGSLHSMGIVLAAASACLLLASLVARRSAQPSPA